MYRLYIALFTLLISGLGVYGLAKSVKFRPWTRPGQEEEYREFLEVLNRAKEKPEEAALPVVAIEETSFHFGTMPPMSNGSHTFRITNAGKGPLILRRGASTCICTMSDLSVVELAPQESHDVTLSWMTRVADRDFAHSVNVTTNDPFKSEVQLNVTGEVAVLLGTTKSAIEFNEVVPDTVSSDELILFTDLWNEIQVDRIQTSSPNISCSMQPKPGSIVSVPERSKAFLAFQVTTSVTESTDSDFVRIYVRPDAEWLKKTLETKNAVEGLNLQEDGTLLVHIPVYCRLLRRFGLYGPSIKNTDNRIINFGNHFVSKTVGQEWKLVGRMRGNIKPDEVRVTLSGMPGMSAKVEPAPVQSSSKEVGESYRITVRIDEQQRPVIYDQYKPGKLRVYTPGLPGSESVEFDVYMVVLADNS